MRSRTAVLDELVAELGRRTGLRTHRGRMDVLQRVFERHLEAHADTHLDDPAFMDALLDAAAIDESYFFRHGDQLAFLRSTVLARLVGERRPGHVLSLWSAGCADGEEPYTLAMILSEEGLGDRSHVLGTDVSAGALERARAATYSPWSLRSADVLPRSHLFGAVDRRYRLSSEVTEQVTFRRHNLLDPAYPRPAGGAGFDVILCRNVLVHLEPAAASVVMPRLAASLAPGGWLLTAPADPPFLGAAGAGDLEPVVLPTGGLVYRRVDRDRDGHGRPSPPPRRTVDRPRPDAGRRRPPAHVAGGVEDLSQPVPAGPDEVDGRRRLEAARRLLADAHPAAAVREAQAAAFLEPDLPAAHLTLGMASAETGRHAVAARAFHRAAELLESLPPYAPVELCDGETAGRLADLARAHALLMREASA